jgi:hypothetical protein
MSTASASVCAFPRKALWLSACIAKLMRDVPPRRVAPQGLTFEMLEPCDGKLSRTVLRGERGREAPDLPGRTGLLRIIAFQYNGSMMTDTTLEKLIWH